MARYLLVGSTQAHSGKSSIVLALGLFLRQQGYHVGYYKPLGWPTCDSSGFCVDEDSRFLGERLQLFVPAPLALLESPVLERALLQEESSHFQERLDHQLAKIRQRNGESVDRVLIECGGTPNEGYFLGLSLHQLAQRLEADLLMVVRYTSLASLEALVGLRERLPGAQMGVILNDIPETQYDHLKTVLLPALEARGLQVLGLLPSNPILKSISVGELAQKLSAEILCGRDHLDLLIEQVNIGAMTVSAALRFFRRMANKVVVTGGDRTDIQMAALQTSTSCLVLTGQLPPDPKILARAEELEVPVLSVSYDTLRTVRLIELAIAEARFQEPVKVECMQDLIQKNLDLEKFCTLYGWSLP